MQQAVRTIKVRVGLSVCSIALLSAALAGVAFAQESSRTSESDHETIKALLQRVSQLEAEIQELKASQGKPAPPAQSEAAPSPAVTTPPASENEAVDVHQAMEQPALKFHGLQFRGFADVGWHASDLKGATNSFALGQLDLFMTSQLSPKLNVLGELVFESDESNTFGVDLERFLLQYAASDYFKLGIGRYHTAIGYYNGVPPRHVATNCRGTALYLSLRRRGWNSPPSTMLALQPPALFPREGRLALRRRGGQRTYVAFLIGRSSPEYSR